MRTYVLGFIRLNWADAFVAVFVGIGLFGVQRATYIDKGLKQSLKTTALWFLIVISIFGTVSVLRTL